MLLAFRDRTSILGMYLAHLSIFLHLVGLLMSSHVLALDVDYPAGEDLVCAISSEQAAPTGGASTLLQKRSQMQSSLLQTNGEEAEEGHRASDGRTAPSAELCVLPAALHVQFTETCENYLHIASEGVDLSGMQQEYESVQLLLRGSEPFRVEVESTIRFPLKWYQVGYVYTKQTGRVKGSGGGWRPDPLLEPSSNGVSVPAHFSQPLWLTWHFSSSAPVQEQGEVLVKINGVVTHRIPLSVKVGHVVVPSVWNASVKQLWGFQERYLEPIYGSPVPPSILSQFQELLSSHRVPVPAKPEDYSKRATPIITFPLPYVANTMPDGTEYANGATFPNCQSGSLSPLEMDKAVALVRKQVNDLVKQGWPYVYGYGKDEPDAACANLLRQAYARFKEIPNLKIIAATNWDGDLMKPDYPMDAWVQLYHRYNDTAAKAWVDAGKEMWGYHCIEPSESDFMNLFIERPLIHSRLLFWLAAQRHYNGWLYWVDNLWRSCPEAGASARHALRSMNSTHTALMDFPAESYIWCPQITDIFANGDGYYVYPGEHGPINSQRLQQIRDGLEELELFRMLPDKSSIAELTKSLVRGPTDWTDDPTKLRSVRACALDAATKALLRRRADNSTGLTEVPVVDSVLLPVGGKQLQGGEVGKTIPKIDTYVINLDSRHDRCVCMSKQLAFAPQAVYRRAAVGLDSCPELSDDIATLYGSRNHTAEKSLFCSNYLIWKHARASEADFIVVLEDDALIDDGFWEQIQRFVTDCATFDYVTVDSWKASGNAEADSVGVCSGHPKLFRPNPSKYLDYWGTAVQVIRRDFLDVLIARAQTHGMGPLDVWWMMRINDGRSFSWQPGIALTAEVSGTKYANRLRALECLEAVRSSDIAPVQLQISNQFRFQCP